MPRRLIAVPALLVGGALLLSGCSSSDSESGTGASAGTSGSGATSASPSPLPTDGAELVTAATAALADADSFHVEGSIASGAEQIDIDIRYGAGDVAQGTLDAGSSGTVELRRVADGTVYANASAAFYAQGDGSGPDLSSIAGRWVVVGDDAPAVLATSVSLLDRDDLATSLQPDDGADDTYDVSGPEDVDGTSAYIVTDKDGSTFAVAADGAPLPVRITNSDANGGAGEISFDSYGDEVGVDAPDSGEIVEIPA